MKFIQVAFAQVAIKVYEVFDTNVSLAATMISVTGKKASGIGERGRGQGAEDGISLDSKSADKELKAVTPKKLSLCHYLYQKSWCSNTIYSESEVVMFSLNKPN